MERPALTIPPRRPQLGLPIQPMERAASTIPPRRPQSLPIQAMENFCTWKKDTLRHIANCELCLQAFYATGDALARMNFNICLDSSELEWFRKVHSTISEGVNIPLLKCANILKYELETLLEQRKSPVDLHKISSSIQSFVYASSEHCDAKDCAICIENFVEGDKGYRIIRCSHEFHEKCLDEWTNTSMSCPLCRTLIQKGQVFDWCKRQFK